MISLIDVAKFGNGMVKVAMAKVTMKSECWNFRQRRRG